MTGARGVEIHSHSSPPLLKNLESKNYGKEEDAAAEKRDEAEFTRREHERMFLFYSFLRNLRTSRALCGDVFSQPNDGNEAHHQRIGCFRNVVNSLERVRFLHLILG